MNILHLTLCFYRDGYMSHHYEKLIFEKCEMDNDNCLRLPNTKFPIHTKLDGQSWIGQGVGPTPLKKKATPFICYNLQSMLIPLLDFQNQPKS